MKTIFIMYLPGHAGQFMARLFTLGEETMPQLPIRLLENMISTGYQQIDRQLLYSYKHVKQQYGSWQNFHQAWADYYNDGLYRILNNSCLDNTLILVYGIHPHEFVKCQTQINNTKNAEFYFVSLDEQFQIWVDESSKQLHFHLRPDELEQYNNLQNEYHMKEISLTKMLESNDSFLSEYTRCCSEMELTAHHDDAQELYTNWVGVRFKI